MAKLKTGRHTSAIKAWRQSQRRASRNRGIRKHIRQAAREVLISIEKKDFTASQKALPKVMSGWDKAAKKGVIHWKTAARKKSRLSMRVNASLVHP